MNQIIKEINTKSSEKVHINNNERLFHPLLIEIREKSSNHAFNQLLYQFMLSHEHYVKQIND